MSSTDPSTQITHYPTTYLPQPVHQSIFEIFSALFSRSNGLRLKLNSALNHPDQFQKKKKVQSALEKNLRHFKATHQNSTLTTRDALLFLAWSNLQENNLQEAAKYLAPLDKLFPSLQQKVSLRWEMIQKCMALNNQCFLTQAKLFFADPLVTLDQSSSAIEEILDFVYVQLRIHCPGLIEIMRQPITLK